ncbi:MAG TPA: hypothetical protein VJ647_05485 [Chitinophagaceae bacterium]|nr:hypothetical protein [Chitinophagaceae bacterium]
MQLPFSLLESLKDVKGFNKEAFESVHAERSPVTSIRLNPAKPFNVQDMTFNLAHPVPWSSYGYYLPVRPSFTFDPLFHGGL